MIENKKELIEYMDIDNDYFSNKDKWSKFIMTLTKDPESEIYKYTRYLRKQEYYGNTCKGNKLKVLLHLYYRRRKNIYGNRLGFLIEENSFGKGLTIYHHGSIIVNPNARIGKNCKLHGNNCIGNNGQLSGVPQIGDNVDIGFGASIIGDIKIANNIKIGAGAVVTKSFLEEGITLVGIPARKI
jgi:serine O-acetyltransferase